MFFVDKKRILRKTKGNKGTTDERPHVQEVQRHKTHQRPQSSCVLAKQGTSN